MKAQANMLFESVSARKATTAMILIIALAAIVLIFQPIVGTSQAYASPDKESSEIKPNLSLTTASSGFEASTYYLDLSPKVVEVPYGHKYIPVHKTVIVKIPDASYYPVTWKSSNGKVATAKDSYKNKEMKLVVYGNSRGTATITITNSATYEKIKIRVVVRGYDSTDFKVSKSQLDLTPKKKTIKGGYRYTPKSKIVTVAVPDGASVSWKSSDTHIATAAWTKEWNGNTTKLKITGHARGTATITLKNSKTDEKLKIKVNVGGYAIGFRLSNPLKSKDSTGRYQIDRFKIINDSKRNITFTDGSGIRYWTKDKSGYYVANGWDHDLIRDLPVTVESGAQKFVYFGQKVRLNSKGKFLNKDDREWENTTWERMDFVLKVGGAYKTIYVDNYGMVTKVCNGRDFFRDFKVSKSKLYLSEGERRIVTVTAPKNAEAVYWDVVDEDVASAKWIGDWTGDSTKLAITGIESGITVVTITNDKTDEELDIEVVVD